MGKYAFGGLFSRCAALASAPALPAEELAEDCYQEMFWGCTSLTEAPILPATTLASRCYCDMFEDCTSLTKAPALPATTLAERCYGDMFRGCTSLEEAPELPAEELAEDCYQEMFWGCTALASAPALPATTLAERCYESMFRGCTALASAPALPATTLAERCYGDMFRGCTALASAPALPATTLARYCYYSMFAGSGVKLSEEPGTFNGVFYGTPYRIPSEGTGTDADRALADMFSGTGGPFKGTPAISKTYYLPGAPEGCILFTSDKPFEVSLGSPDNQTWNGTIQYSLDGGTWSEYTAGAPIGSGGGCAVYFRGKGNTGLSVEVENDVYRRSTFSLTPTAGHTVSCSGNIETLLDYEKVKNGEHPTMGKIAFYRLFYGCTSLASAPELPAETLADGCYENMFYECTSLTEAPILPATTLASRCYCDMFEDCTSLTKAPALPAETLAASCYQGMFRGCTSLAAAPALPAEELAYGCYHRMFLGCTVLTTPPNLPAKTLAASCYNGMFYGCTSLTEAPALPATALAEYCYEDMFFGCTSLTEAPALPATTLTESCYYRMFYGCTSLTEAPALPAKELADSCYKAMFYGCTSLTKAPALPAEKLFAVNAHGTVTRFGDCYAGMFGGCTSLTEAPALPAKEIVYNCYDRMFIGCTSLTTPPALPATTLAEQCYRRMFENSGVRLSEEPGTFDGVSYNTPYRIPSEGTGTDADSALADMFAGTGGPFEGGTPVINKTYYLPATPVDAPVGKTLPYTGAEQTGVESGEGYALAGEKATDAGGHTATATLQDGYAWSDGTVGAKDVLWKIAPKPATIAVDGASKVQGEADPAFTGKVEGLVKAGDLGEVAYERTNADVEAPGTYAGVLTATYTANANYEVTVVPGDFTIEPAPVPPEPADRSALEEGVEACAAALASAIVSADGSDVDPADRWVTQADADALSAAIAAARTVLSDEGATQAQVDAATASLAAALGRFEAAKRPGAKPAPEPEPQVWERIAGKTALDTMSEVVDAGGFEPGGTVVLASLEGYWDALAAAGIAGLEGAPVLMVPEGFLGAQAAAQLAKLAPAKIIACGGTDWIPALTIEQAAAAAGTSPEVVRLAGDVAVGTAEEIAKAGAGRWSGTAIVATVGTFQDALAAAPLSYAKAMPVYFAGYDPAAGAGSLAQSTIDSMKASGISRAYVAGGEYWLPASIEKQLSDAGIQVVKRLAGATAVETSAAIAGEAVSALGFTADGMGVADISRHYDALASAAFCGKANTVLALALDERSSVIGGFVSEHASDISRGYVFGGPASVSDATLAALEAATRGGQGQ